MMSLRKAIALLSFLTLNATEVVAVAEHSQEPECAYYLTKSKLDGAMRGVFAGKDFSAEEFVEAGPVVNVKSAHIK
jgi:hypothetical protein